MPVYTHRRPACMRSPVLILRYILNIYLFLYTFYFNLYSKQACWSLVGFCFGMLVSNVSPIRHVCWSPMGHVGFRWVTNEACRGLWWASNQACWSPLVILSGMSVSNGTPIRHNLITLLVIVDWKNLCRFMCKTSERSLFRLWVLTLTGRRCILERAKRTPLQQFVQTIFQKVLR